jgi:demethylmenaquinone methyltransferase/2-methoxy-6-polyprenyl-1,4-benzoquinol methylase
MEVKPYKDKLGSKKEQVAGMFDSIAHRYDFLNHFLSVGIDKIWRRKAIAKLKGRKVSTLLDIATGTGDFAIEAMRRLNIAHIKGVDISEQMLAVGREKLSKLSLQSKIELEYGDSENLQFETNTFDAITAAFGVRNFENLNKGLSEMFRVLKPGGMVVILEFSKPANFPFKQLYNFYFKYILPVIGKLVSKDNSAYSYLPESVKHFPDGRLFVEELKKAGFEECCFKTVTFGVATIYTGVKN